MSTWDARAGELLAWSAATGLQLPLSVPEILALEDAGHVVDLETGIVLVDAVSVRIGATVIGEATDTVLKLDGMKT